MKKIKDPIYGYIELDKNCSNILDTPYFQRLRYIIQTSYTSIYPSSLHNRFSHSLGVYFLGEIASNSLIKDCETEVKKVLVLKKSKVFLLACLLHDLGHAPFSHTGEKFYFENKNNDVPVIWSQLISKLNSSDFNDDSKNVVIGKEHEIMSALLSVNLFEDHIGSENLNFFVRCIVGLKHSQSTETNMIENAFIELLNSDIIDVDKLDYIIRDSYMSGYNSISIDYIRLLESVSICEKAPNLCYGKKAISVIESVIIAHDMERKWIQVHPVIQYESFLIKIMIREIGSLVNKQGKFLFSYDSLLNSPTTFEYLEKGSQETKHPINIKLLSDYDILHIAKNIVDSEIGEEFYSRDKRMHPVWKSESQYRLFFNEKIKESQNLIFVNLLNRIENDILDNTYKTSFINQKLLDAYVEELTKSKEELKCCSENHRITLERNIKIQEKKKGLVEVFKQISTEEQVPFDFIIITQKQFKSNINKDSFQNLQIKLNNETEDLNKLLLFNNKEIIDDKFFYLYYRREKNIPYKTIAQKLISFAVTL